MNAKLNSLIYSFIILLVTAVVQFSSATKRPPEDPWSLLPLPPTLTPEMRLQFLQFNLADAIENLLEHPEVKANLRLGDLEKSQIAAALKEYQAKLGLALENNNQLWKKVGGDQSLAEANQSALNKHQAELRNQLREIFSRQQFEQFERFWFTAGCDWVQTMPVALDLPMTDLQTENHRINREQLDKQYDEMLESFQTDLEALRLKYRRKWTEELPESLREVLTERLLKSEAFSSGCQETF